MHLGLVVHVALRGVHNVATLKAVTFTHLDVNCGVVLPSIP